VADFFTSPSVSGLCLGKMPFRVLLAPEPGRTLVAQIEAPSSWALVVVSGQREKVPGKPLLAKKRPPRLGLGNGKVWYGFSSSLLLVAPPPLHCPLVLQSLVFEYERALLW